VIEWGEALAGEAGSSGVSVLVCLDFFRGMGVVVVTVLGTVPCGVVVLAAPAPLLGGVTSRCVAVGLLFLLLEPVCLVALVAGRPFLGEVLFMIVWGRDASVTRC
jgi:hypothetical protein